jgi:hypothetical protein
MVYIGLNYVKYTECVIYDSLFTIIYCGLLSRTKNDLIIRGHFSFFQEML